MRTNSAGPALNQRCGPIAGRSGQWLLELGQSTGSIAGQNIPPPLFKNYMRPSQNLPLPSRIYPPFQQIAMCDPPRIYPTLPEYTPPPLFNELIFATLPESTHPPRIYPLFNKCICATHPASTPPFQNLPHFSTTMCDPPGIYPCLPECTPLLTTKCDLPRIHPSLLEYTPTFFNNYIIITLPESTLPSQNISPFLTIILSCDAPRIYPSLPEYTPISTTKCDTPRNYPSLREYTPLFDDYMPPSLSEYIPPHLSTTMCDIPRIYPLVTYYAPFSRHYM